jgi:hypothetical protein
MRHRDARPTAVDAQVRELFAQLVRHAYDAIPAGGTASQPFRLSDLANGVTYPDVEMARDDGRLLYDAGRRLGISVSAWPTDPGTGKCKNCDGWPRDGAACRPSRRGVSDLHYRAFPKAEGRRHVVEAYGDDPELWPYAPGRQDQVGNGDSEPQRAFGADGKPASEAQPPNRGGLLGGRGAPKPAAARTGRSAPESDSGRGQPRQTPAQAEPETALAKIRRWASG